MSEETNREQGKGDSETEKLRQNVEATESKHELFQRKVSMVGELHTERAFMANRIGGLKSEARITHDDLGDDIEGRIKKLETSLKEISKDISDFSPDSIEELEEFCKKTKERFKELEDLFQVTRKKEEELSEGEES